MNLSYSLIPPAPRSEALPLSFSQERLWFLDQLEPQSPFYNVSRALRLTGRLDVDALKKSLDAIVARHEILRSNIVVVGSSQTQVIHKAAPIDLTLTDLSLRPQANREAEMHRLLKAEADRPFDLSSDPMLRATLLRLSEEDHALLLVTHHIASDGWSMGILLRELAALYTAFSKGDPSPLPELPIQYADFSIWQRRRLQGDVLQAQLAYWKGQLSGVPVLELPTDRLRPPVQTFRGARQSLKLSKILLDQLKKLSRSRGVTLFMTSLAAFQTLLYRYTGPQDIVVGSPIANRNWTEIEGLIGFFANTLALRTDMSGNPRFGELMARVRKVALDAYEYQDLPFEKLVEELHPDRSLSHNPVFQVMFVMQNTPRSLLHLPELEVTPIEIDTETAKFDLNLSLTEEAGSLTACLEYNTDLFDGATIGRMLAHFQTLLQSIVENPERRIAELPILPEDERRRLLFEWNATRRDYRQGRCIHELFEAQVERTPDATAVIFEDRHLTYRELNRRADQLANRLQQLGVGPEARVGLCVERSPEMIVGLLGILKAGAAYVPLDPEYPKDRLAFMLEDCQAQVLLTQRKLVGRLPATRALELLDQDWTLVSHESERKPVDRANEANIAYIIYTSGSTGRPKGVAIEHRNTVAFLEWARTVFTQTQLDGVLASTSICFDLSVFELFAPLCWGGKVVLARDIFELPSLPAANDVTLINTVPSAVPELLRMGALPVSVRTVNLAGEALHAALVKNLYEHARVDQVFDLYGPSESTTYSSFALRNADGPETIGRPIFNTQIYLLDAHSQPVPIGVAGELHIGGKGVARGYVNCPELTAERFIPDPFRNEPGARLYKTGDLARYLQDGKIEFLGRIDHQAKVRGFRIEPGEVEVQLNRHPAVRQVAVLVREDVPGDKRLVAYVVVKPTPTCSAAELRDFLKTRLPGYLVPSSFVMLDALPVTPNGKLDRGALPAPDENRPELQPSFVEPRTAVEQTLASIWAQVLRMERVGVRDNFFDLGGHSLLATQVAFRIRQAFQVEFPLRAIFEGPTIEELAKMIGDAGADDRTDTELSRILGDIESISEEEAQRLTTKSASYP
jgi:amino acid adenylation domain-containing protein